MIFFRGKILAFSEDGGFAGFEGGLGDGEDELVAGFEGGG